VAAGIAAKWSVVQRHEANVERATKDVQPIHHSPSESDTKSHSKEKRIREKKKG
jgi:hypothetical protein